MKRSGLIVINFFARCLKETNLGVIQALLTPKGYQLGPDYTSQAGVSFPGSWHVCFFYAIKINFVITVHDKRDSPVSRDSGIVVPGSQVTGLRFFHVIMFAEATQLISPSSHRNQA